MVVILLTIAIHYKVVNQLFASYLNLVRACSVEASVLEVVVLVVVSNRLGEWKCLLFAVPTFECYFPHHCELFV